MRFLTCLLTLLVSTSAYAPLACGQCDDACCKYDVDSDDYRACRAAIEARGPVLAGAAGTGGTGGRAGSSSVAAESGGQSGQPTAATVCAMMEVHGEEPVRTVKGYVWEGVTCVPWSYARCQGVDCEKIFRGTTGFDGKADCLAYYAACRPK